VSERKPPGVPWESWIDKQVRRAHERGEFDELPGSGKPLSDLGKPFDPMRWVKDKLRREGLSYMSPSVALREEARVTLEAALGAASETEVRELIADINERIREANRKGIRGPALMLIPFDVERVVREWHRERHTD
jgi:hypothetical protein